MGTNIFYAVTFTLKLIPLFENLNPTNNFFNSEC